MVEKFLINISESLKAIRANLLRSVLTATIICIGISSLVGMLTAVSGIEGSVGTNLGGLGGGTLDIYPSGKDLKQKNRFSQTTVFRQIDNKESSYLEDNLKENALVCRYVDVSWIAEAKAGEKKTNPNSIVKGANANYLGAFKYALEKGRNFLDVESSRGARICIIGVEVEKSLFGPSSALNQDIVVLGNRMKVVGVLKSKGNSFGGASTDRFVLVPLAFGEALFTGSNLNYNMRVLIDKQENREAVLSQTTNLMRRARADKPRDKASFVIYEPESLNKSITEISSTLYIGSTVIAAITLLGAAIALMNIMIVNVSERTKEIGIRKALGGKPIDIQNQFLTEAILICLFGGLMGIVIGVAIGNLVSGAVGSEEFTLPIGVVSIALLVCFFVGLLSGFYPAKRASRLDPIESLRYE